jgi:cellulose synthase/poly-beta-1,6-N-acetylglucosamine synthase-like glycosyltransferase
MLHLNYPNSLFEVILVDDDSEDDSADAINTFLNTFSKDNDRAITVRIIKNKHISNSPKKDAITTAINIAKYEWILTTDADCILPKFWLDSFDVFIQQHTPVCIVAPVTYIDNNTFLNRFQQLDFFSLQGATIGAFGIKKPFLCNGANFGYTKTVFKNVNGFNDNNSIASGDDIFLLEKIIKKHPEYVKYLKHEHAIISTRSQPTWHQLITQRIRWAAKTSNYNNWFGKFTGIVVFFMNFIIAVLPIIALIGFYNIKVWLYILVIKLNIDFLLLYKTSAFFSQRKAFRSFLTSFFLYPLFSINVALLSMFKNYEWKGRSFKR